MWHYNNFNLKKQLTELSWFVVLNYFYIIMIHLQTENPALKDLMQ